jgi:hypothetical protein
MGRQNLYIDLVKKIIVSFELPYHLVLRLGVLEMKLTSRAVISIHYLIIWS